MSRKSLLHRLLPLLVLTPLLCASFSMCLASEDKQDQKEEQAAAEHRRQWPARKELVGYALKHIERHDLLGDANTIEDFALMYKPRLSRTFLRDPLGAWELRFYDREGERTLVISVNAEGKLLEMDNSWPFVLAGGQRATKELPEPFEKALARAKKGVKTLRGDFPADLILSRKKLVVDPSEVQSTAEQYRTPYWTFSWHQQDGKIEYALSWIRVVVSKKDDVVEFTDQYLGLKTKYVAELSREDALVRARKVVEEAVLPGYSGAALKWEVDCSEHPRAFVWKVPGSAGDQLLWTCWWTVHATWPDGDKREYSGGFSIDAVTGRRATANTSAGHDWAHGREGQEDEAVSGLDAQVVADDLDIR